METSIMLYQANNRKNKETSEKKQSGKLLKFAMLVFVLFSITMLSSCFVGAPQTGQVSLVVKNEQQDNHTNHIGRYDMGLDRGHRQY